MVSSCGKKPISKLFWFFFYLSVWLKYISKTSDENCETVESDSESIDEQNSEEENESAEESDCEDEDDDDEDDEDEENDENDEDDLVQVTQQFPTQNDVDEVLNRTSKISFQIIKKKHFNKIAVFKGLFSIKLENW